MPIPIKRDRPYWRNIALVTSLAVVIGGLAVAGFIVVLTVRYATNVLHPDRLPITRMPPDVGIFEYEDVVFASSDGVELHGWYVKPQNGAVVILAHGYTGNRQDLLPEAGILVGQGYGALLFDFRGHGESGDALVTIGDHERRDLTAAIDFVIQQPDVDPARIGALGFSMGGATLAQVAARDDRLRAVVIEAAFPALKNMVQNSARLLGPLTQLPVLWAMRREGVDIDDVRPIDDLCEISPRAVFLIYGDQDTVVSSDKQEALFDAVCEPAETWLIEGAEHQNFTEVVPGAYQDRLVAFFDTWLQE